MKNMNIYVMTMLVILGVILALILLLYVLSGFDSLTLIVMPVLFGMGALFILLFITTSFILGLKGTEHIYWGIGSLLIFGLLNYLFLPSCTMAADPKIVYATLKIITFFVIAFGCGYLWRAGENNNSYLFIITKILSTVCSAFLLGYITMANLLAFGDISLFWNEAAYNSDKTLFYEQKIRISPFPARVIGVRYYNKCGLYAGASAKHPINSKLIDMRLGETPNGNADIFLNKKYKPVIAELLADCKEALRYESGRTTVYLFYKNDTLRRIETDYHENGVVSKIRRYRSMPGNEYDVVKKFDELGTPLQTDDSSNLLSRLWSIHDFRIEAEVPRINYGYDDPNHPKLDKRLCNVLNSETLFEQMRDSLKAMGQLGDNLSVALLLEGFATGDSVSISVAIDAYSRYGDNNDTGFECMNTVEDMDTICDALALCRLESAITERIVNYGEDRIRCPRIRIKENTEQGKYVILYLLEDRAISSDFKYCFVFDPSAHSDPKKQNDAASLWEQTQQMADKYKERSTDIS